MAAVAVGVDAGDGFFVELGEEDVGDGVMDGLGGVLEKIGEADVEAAFAEADGGVEGGEAAEADVERGDGGARAEFAVLVLEDSDEGGGWGDFPGAWLSGFRWMKCYWGRLEEESWRGRGRRRKELQELTQGRWAGMLRGGQGWVLVCRLVQRSFYKRAGCGMGKRRWAQLGIQQRVRV